MRPLIHTFVLLIAVSACALDPAREPAATSLDEDMTAANIEAQSAASHDTAATDALEDGTAATVTPAAGCSFVQFCNAPGADGTICRQQGCSLSSAIAECRSDANFVCGGLVCPAFIITLSGSRVQIC